jgi:hypothetical protein
VAEHGVVILGSGSLARSICYSLAVDHSARFVVTVVSRTPSSSAEVCYIANARAASSGAQVRFHGLALEHYSTDSISLVLRQVRPVIVLNCASYQSPWEKDHSPSAWTALLSRAGFGITLPLQAAVAVEAASAAAGLDPPPLFLNACFPDAVNPLLNAMGLPIFCGLGNVALLAASIRESLGLGPERRLRVVGHHWHLHPPGSADDEALAWLDGTPVHGVGSLLTRQRAAARSELNLVTGHVTALLLAGLVAGREMWVNLPGPLGLTGGYPVRIHGPAIELDLPTEMRPRALTLNSRWAERDGVLVEDSGKITFAEHSVREIRAELPNFAHTVRVADIPAVRSELLNLRSHMRLRRAGCS